MHTELAFPERIELSILCPEIHLVVENHRDCVVIRAAQRSISPSQKSSFIRYLAAEGYIPERYQWFEDSEPEFKSGLKWFVGDSLSQVRPFAERHTLPKNIRGFVYTVLAWLTIATMILVYELRWEIKAAMSAQSLSATMSSPHRYSPMKNGESGLPPTRRRLR